MGYRAKYYYRRRKKYKINIMVKNILLFTDSNHKPIRSIDLLDILMQIGAAECDTLYIHSAMSFGTPNPQLRRNELLQSIYEIFLELNVKTICMPTFTFSFCNGQIYDPVNSKSKMGALNEYFRRQNNVIRSIDPLMSVALLGEDQDLVKGIEKTSMGINSTFDKLRHRNNVKFLFLGTRIGDCFTYMHYLEWLYKVDYRYERKFQGTIQFNNRTYNDDYSLFVRYCEVLPNLASYDYERMMYDNGRAEIKALGNSTISVVEEKVAAEAFRQCLEIDPHFFVTIADDKLVKDTTFILNSEMVAL